MSGAAEPIIVLSMLHEPAAANSATRPFRRRPVIGWTSARLRRLPFDKLVACWTDQAASVTAAGAQPLVVGDRRAIPQIEAMSAARRWADGWRGGLLSSCEFDPGFHVEALCKLDRSVMLVDPSSALIDPAIVEAVIERGRDDANEIAFSPAAPGFAAILLKPVVLERLAKAKLSPGALLSYRPDAPMRDPLGSPGCVAPPLAVARTPRRFRIDSDCQGRRFEGLFAQATDDELISMSAEEVVRLAASMPLDALPRDVTVELTTARNTRPIFAPRDITRTPMSLQAVDVLFEQLARRDDARVTFAGVGDPLLHDGFAEVVTAARDAGISAIHVETDLLADERVIESLASLPIDVVSVHLPAVTAATYAAVMGGDHLATVMRNVQSFLSRRAELGRGTPIFAPTFVKTRRNLPEMEAWYDAWLRAAGSAVIVAPSDLAGTIDDVSVGDMAPPQRVPCRRIASRMTVLSDGTVVSCEEDLLGRKAIGRIGEQPLEEMWRDGFGRLRSMHADRRWDGCAVCGRCREWHRP